MKIFIGGLPKDITESDLREAFEDFGEVSSSKVVSDKSTGISRGFGFVEMPDREKALKAIEVLHEAVVDGNTVSVKSGENPPVKEVKKPDAGKNGFKHKNIHRKNTTSSYQKAAGGNGKRPRTGNAYNSGSGKYNKI